MFCVREVRLDHAASQKGRSGSRSLGPSTSIEVCCHHRSFAEKIAKYTVPCLLCYLNSGPRRRTFYDPLSRGHYLIDTCAGSLGSRGSRNRQVTELIFKHAVENSSSIRRRCKSKTLTFYWRFIIADDGSADPILRADFLCHYVWVASGST